METSDMKNMVVLKNLPSNIVEEAIIIFKETQKVKQREFIEKGNKSSCSEIQPKSRDYILKEAEMLVNDYIKKIENQKNKKYKPDLFSKYKVLRRYSITLTIVAIISLVFNFI